MKKLTVTISAVATAVLMYLHPHRQLKYTIKMVINLICTEKWTAPLFSSNKDENGDKSYMRMGIKGETQINDDLTGYGHWEYQIQANTPEK